MTNAEAWSRAELGSTVADDNPVRVAVLEPGTLIAGRYRVEDVLGEGSQGRVYAARDEHRGTAIAIKLPRSDRARKRIEREAFAMHMLRHTNTVSLVEYLVTHDPPLLVMERLSRTLARQIKDASNHRVALAELSALGLGILAALEHIHGEGWVHRDVKPSNIAWAAHGADDAARLLDLGLAKRWTNTDSPPPKFVGTARYASLPVLRGGLPTPIDDLWGLFYALLHAAVGGLPWSRFDSRSDIVASHEATAGERLCAGLPSAFARMHRALREAPLGPPYAIIRTNLRELSGCGTDAMTPLFWSTSDWDATSLSAAFAAAAAWRNQPRR